MDVRGSAGFPRAAAGGRMAAWAAKAKSVKIGFDYLHSVVDDHSRLAYSEILPDEKALLAPRSCSALSVTSPITGSPGSSGS